MSKCAEPLIISNKVNYNYTVMLQSIHYYCTLQSALCKSLNTLQHLTLIKEKEAAFFFCTIVLQVEY